MQEEPNKILINKETDEDIVWNISLRPSKLSEFIGQKDRQSRNLRDLQLINKNVDYLNKEVIDTLSYQVKI